MSYRAYGFKLTEQQKQQLATGVKNKHQVVLRLTHAQLQGPDQIKITVAQAAKIQKALSTGKGITLKFSYKQLHASKAITGGFLGALLTAVAPTLINSLFGGQGIQEDNARKFEAMRKVYKQTSGMGFQEDAIKFFSGRGLFDEYRKLYEKATQQGEGMGGDFMGAMKKVAKKNAMMQEGYGIRVI